MAQLLADEVLAGAALEEELAGFGVFREEVGLVVDELERTAAAGGGALPATCSVKRWRRSVV